VESIEKLIQPKGATRKAVGIIFYVVVFLAADRIFIAINVRADA
jgi:hypothetical protein